MPSVRKPHLRPILRKRLTSVRLALTPFSKKRKRIASRFTWWLGLSIVVIGVFSYLTNPFVRFSLVKSSLPELQIQNEVIILDQSEKGVILRDKAFYSQLAFVKSGWHIFSGKFSGGSKASMASVDQIINEIHLLRFDPSLPFIISGDHFSVFYNRSLGIFYHSLLDARTALDQTDWTNRQLIYARSLQYALAVYDQSSRLSTTIVPVGPQSVALLNIYAYPSDTMYSLLYGLQALLSPEIHQIYTYESEVNQNTQLQTQQVGQHLLEQYRESLIRHFNTYIDFVVDPSTGLVRKDIEVSSTKDLVRRQSSFYDNVIVWRTYQLANELGLIELEEDFLDNLKQRILNTYWLKSEGYFLDHLSDESIQNNHYSSDWLIAYQTGFLDPETEADRAYITPILEYIRRNALNRPFGIAYQAERRPWETHFFPKTFAPDYGSTAIWSNWGMEYTKLLTDMAQVTGEISYLNEAEHQISAYAYNIRRYRGYPEVYNNEGDFFKQTLYSSIRQTGWVVSFEQARAMVDWTKLNWEEIISNQKTKET